MWIQKLFWNKKTHLSKISWFFFVLKIGKRRFHLPGLFWCRLQEIFSEEWGKHPPNWKRTQARLVPDDFDNFRRWWEQYLEETHWSLIDWLIVDRWLIDWSLIIDWLIDHWSLIDWLIDWLTCVKFSRKILFSTSFYRKMFVVRNRFQPQSKPTPIPKKKQQNSFKHSQNYCQCTRKASLPSLASFLDAVVCPVSRKETLPFAHLENTIKMIWRNKR